MRVLILHNPAAGRGRGATIARELASLLERDAHRVVTHGVGAASADPAALLRERAADAEILLIAGGDGTVHHTLPIATELGRPVFHVPLGTENLFARHFNMRAHAPTIRDALRERRIARVDAATLNADGASRMFCLMVGAGPDAGVIRRLCGARRGPISHLSYLGPILRETMSPHIPRITVDVDGKRVVDARTGQLVVANCREYAVGLNPAHRACMRDGLVDAVFHPAPAGALGSLFAGAWMVASCLRVSGDGRLGCVHASGSRVRVIIDHARPTTQVDGELGPAAREIEIAVVPRALRVLLPPGTSAP
ncbi:MAG TPA: diacylglycerol kinase family protein [Phycisphaerales bacterium]|nr:diacylglycerol kinase family protein [Phycisphaerales bacterium]